MMKKNLWFSLFRGQQQIFSNANIHEEQKSGSGEIVYWLDTWAFTDLKLKIKTYFFKKEKKPQKHSYASAYTAFHGNRRVLGVFLPRHLEVTTSMVSLLAVFVFL